MTELSIDQQETKQNLQQEIKTHLDQLVRQQVPPTSKEKADEIHWHLVGTEIYPPRHNHPTAKTLRAAEDQMAAEHKPLKDMRSFADGINVSYDHAADAMKHGIKPDGVTFITRWKASRGNTEAQGKVMTAYARSLSNEDFREKHAAYANGKYQRDLETAAAQLQPVLSEEIYNPTLKEKRTVYDIVSTYHGLRPSDSNRSQYDRALSMVDTNN